VLSPRTCEELAPLTPTRRVWARAWRKLREEGTGQLLTVRTEVPASETPAARWLAADHGAADQVGAAVGEGLEDGLDEGLADEVVVVDLAVAVVEARTRGLVVGLALVGLLVGSGVEAAIGLAPVALSRWALSVTMAPVPPATRAAVAVMAAIALPTPRPTRPGSFTPERLALREVDGTGGLCSCEEVGPVMVLLGVTPVTGVTGVICE